jgi:hypothetical protein
VLVLLYTNLSVASKKDIGASPSFFTFRLRLIWPKYLRSPVYPLLLSFLEMRVRSQ